MIVNRSTRGVRGSSCGSMLRCRIIGLKQSVRSSTICTLP